MLDWSIAIFDMQFAQSLNAINTSRGKCCDTFFISANITYGLQHCDKNVYENKAMLSR